MQGLNNTNRFCYFNSKLLAWVVQHATQGVLVATQGNPSTSDVPVCDPTRSGTTNATVVVLVKNTGLGCTPQPGHLEISF